LSPRNGEQLAQNGRGRFQSGESGESGLDDAGFVALIDQMKKEIPKTLADLSVVMERKLDVPDNLQGVQLPLPVS
jgi:hypothetical protein